MKKTKTDVYNQELKKLNDIFSKIDDNKQKLAEGLINEASEIKADLFELNEIKNKVGYIKIHPQNVSVQKKTEVGAILLKLQSSYSNIIKVLNSILNKNEIEEEDELDEFIKTMKE